MNTQTQSTPAAAIAGKGVALVDFWAPWCGPCRTQKPIVEQLAEEYAGRASISAVDVDDSPQLAGSYSVYSIPTLVLLKDGAEVGRFVGVQSAERLRAALDAVLAS
jgi:thioredoxin 1